MRHYLGDHHVPALTPEEQQLFSIPSVLRLILEFLEGGGRLQQFRSPGELYDLVCPQLILNAAKKSIRPLAIRTPAVSGRSWRLSPSP